jgi:hypothetical protein
MLDGSVAQVDQRLPTFPVTFNAQRRSFLLEFLMEIVTSGE